MICFYLAETMDTRPCVKYVEVVARASRVLGIGLDRHFSPRMFDKIKAYW